ncbi:MAG: hypothetical protein ABIA93_06390 [Candidatus Woesearchaeota archaeon]
MHTLQEIEVWFVLPALRRELALELKKGGLKQRDIAGLLGLTEAAVSQYLAGKRGVDMHFAADFREEIRNSASHIVSGSGLQPELQRLLRLAESDRTACLPCPMKQKDAECSMCYK